VDGRGETAGARRRLVEAGLVVDELAHEAEVGGDLGVPGLDVLVGLLQTPAISLHQVGDDNSGGPGSSTTAVHQDARPLVPGLVDHLEAVVKHVDKAHVLGGMVLQVEVLVHKVAGVLKAVRKLGGRVDDKADVVGLERGIVLCHLGTSKKEEIGDLNNPLTVPSHFRGGSQRGGRCLPGGADTKGL